MIIVIVVIIFNYKSLGLTQGFDCCSTGCNPTNKGEKKKKITVFWHNTPPGAKHTTRSVYCFSFFLSIFSVLSEEETKHTHRKRKKERKRDRPGGRLNRSPLPPVQWVHGCDALATLALLTVRTAIILYESVWGGGPSFSSSSNIIYIISIIG